ncbi:MAG: hypothetical protein V1860_01350 [bacterium]
MWKKYLYAGLVLSLCIVIFSCGKGEDSEEMTVQNYIPPIAKCAIKSESGFTAGNIITLNAGESSFMGNSASYNFTIISPSKKKQTSGKQSEPLYKFTASETGFYDIELSVEDLAGEKDSKKSQIFIDSLKIFGCASVGNQASVNVKELSWQCNGGANTKFNIYFSEEDEEFFLLGETAKKSFPLEDKLPYGKKFIWKIIAENNNVITEAQNWFRTAAENGPPYISINESDEKYFPGEEVEIRISIEDAEGDEISDIRWEFGTMPLGSDVHFNFAAGEENFFVPDYAGGYTVIIYADDEYGHTGKSSIIISVSDIEVFNVHPANNMTYVPCAGAVFSWECNKEKAYFQIRIGKCGNDYESAPWENAEGEYEYYYAGDFEQGSAYCWSLKTGEYIFPEEGQWKFTAGVNLENLYLKMKYPLEGDSNVPLNGIMRWESNGEKYDVYLGGSEGGMINVSTGQTCKEFDLSGQNLIQETQYFTRVDVKRGNQILQGGVVRFKTAAALPPPPGGPDWQGDDVSFWKTGKVEIRNFSVHLNASGQQLLALGQIPDIKGDFNCWNNCGANVAGVVENGVLKADLAKIPLLKGANRINVTIGADGWTQLHLFSAKDKKILIRTTDASSSSGAGELVIGIYLLDDGTYSPVPDGAEVIAR